TVKKLNNQYFFTSPEVMAQQLHETFPMARELVELTKEFADAFAQEKRRKNLVDFHDLEHFALEILVDRETKQVRSAAEEFRDTFEEIMIDEYQDSNHVQETILRAISREERGENNIFMVGDVKQSIYRFRLARPELFMEKYDTYSTGEGITQRIDLHKNFRSRREVLSCTNDIFYKVMKKSLGNVEYDRDAALYLGAGFVEPEDQSMFAPEILLVDSNDALLSDSEYGGDIGKVSDSKDFNDKKLLEAKVVANRIRKLMEEQLVTDKAAGELRKVRYSDIVILLRSLTGWADAFVGVLNDEGIPAHTVSATGYFSAVEVQTVLAMLRILDNPRQDIPLAAVLRSPMVGMTDEELAQVRLYDRERNFQDCVLQKCEELYTKILLESGENQDLAGNIPGKSDGADTNEKLYDFYLMYRKLRNLVPDTPIHELIEILLKETGYGEYVAAMPAGNRRYANLLMLVEKAIAYENTSYKGLFHFVRYIDELQKYDVDFGEADMVGENENVVRIMSIHKSKSLEFPVVFVSGLGKNFNRQDVRSHMVLHPDLGLGLDFMDGSRRIKSPTIAKRAIAKQIELENLGEELRVLYVALTRAKEKLILTGSRKDAADYLEKRRSEAEISAKVERPEVEDFGQEENPEENICPLSYINRESAAGYLDWIIPALLSYGDKYKICPVSLPELVTEETVFQATNALERAVLMKEISNADEASVEELEKRFSFQYPYQTDIQRKNKYSVSELKHRAMREHFEMEQEEAMPIFVKEEVIPYIPSFVRQAEQMEEEVNQGALRGTAVHRVMECYQFSSPLGAREQIEQMLEEGKISEEMKALVKL
ncbi:MAG: helicase-exonuclease AddAB subunit AddA, partial [Roseburia sp.]|nr:helicase-exonuclease AddAB subunit AddA [Roseburia sp.]